MPTLKVHLGVPKFNQVVVEVFGDPAPALPVGGAAPAAVLERQVLFNIVGDRLEYVGTLRVPNVKQIGAAEYRKIDVHRDDVDATNTADEWNVAINNGAMFDPADFATRIPHYGQFQEVVERSAQRDRDLRTKTAADLVAIRGRSAAGQLDFAQKRNEIENKVRLAGAALGAKINAENAAANARMDARNATVAAMIGGFPAIAPNPPDLSIQEIERLSVDVETKKKSLDSAIKATDTKIANLKRSLAAAQRYATAIRNNNQNSTTASSNLRKLHEAYASIEIQITELEETRKQLNVLMIEATAYWDHARSLRNNALRGATPEIRAKVTNDLVVIERHFNRLSALEYQLARTNLNNVEEKIASLRAQITLNETNLERIRIGEIVPGRRFNRDETSQQIQSDKFLLAAYVEAQQYKATHTLPIDAAFRTLVESKERAEARVTEIAAQEALARRVMDDVTRLADGLEEAKRTMQVLRDSTQRAQRAFINATEAHNRVRLTNNTAEATTLLATAEEAKRIAKEEYEKIREAENVLRVRLSEASRDVVLALSAELDNAGTVDARAVPAAALEKLLQNRESIQRDLDDLRLIDANKGVNRYFYQSLKVGDLVVAIKAQADFVKLKNESEAVLSKINVSHTKAVNDTQTMKEIMLRGTLESIKEATSEAKLLADEYLIKKEYHPGLANRASAKALKRKKRAEKYLADTIQRDSAVELTRILRTFETEQIELQRQIDELRVKQAAMPPGEKARDIEVLIDAATARKRVVETEIRDAQPVNNREKAVIEQQARDAIADLDAVFNPMNVARATSPSKWLDVWEESHGEESPLPNKFSPGRYTKAVRKVLEILMNPTEAEPTVAALTAAADAARPAAAIMMGGVPGAIPRAHAAVDDSPALKNENIIAIIESTHSALKQYSLVKQKESPRNIEALKTLDFATRATEKEKKALLASEERLEKKILFTKHEIPNPDLPAPPAGGVAPPPPPGVPATIVDYIEQKFDTVDMFSKRTKEASVRHYKNSNESTVVSEGTLRTQVTDIVNRKLFPPNPADYPHRDPAKNGKFPIHYDPALSDEEKQLLKDTVIKVFRELGVNRATVEAHVDFDTLPRIAPAPARVHRVR